MSIRFNCGACQTTLKIESMITQEKMVRCKTCGIVIKLTPDLGSPNGIKATIPDPTGRSSGGSRREEARQKMIVYITAGVIGAIILLIIAWNLFL
jgi:uncharacterized Zn finger protein